MTAIKRFPEQFEDLGRDPIDLDQIYVADGLTGVNKKLAYSRIGTILTALQEAVADILDEFPKTVRLTGNQSIENVKLFVHSPIVPAATEGTQAQNRGGVEAQITNRQEGVRSQSTTKSPNSKLLDDQLNLKLSIIAQTLTTLQKAQTRANIEALGFIDLVNDIHTGGVTKVLTAEQGKVLADLIDEFVGELSSAIDTINNNKINKTDLVNDIHTGGTTKVLSAEQGKVLGELIEEFATELSAAIDYVGSQTEATLANFATALGLKIDGAYSEEGLLYLTSDGQVVAGPIEVGSGTGSGAAGSKMTVISLIPTSFAVGVGSEVKLQFTASSVDADTLVPTGDLTIKVIVNNVTVYQVERPQGNIEFDITQWITSGSNSARVTITDRYGSIRGLVYTINAVDVSISSTFNHTVPQSGQISFKYKPIGAFEKTIHFVVDGEQIASHTTIITNREITQLLPAQTHGAHMLEVYVSANIQGLEVESIKLRYMIICLEAGNNATVITSQYFNDTIGQYDSATIPYLVYSPLSENVTVSIYDNDVLISSLTGVGRSERFMEYRADNAGMRTIKFSSGGTDLELSLEVGESIIQFEAETMGLDFALTSANRSNEDVNREVWESGAIAAQFTGFDWVINGWLKDPHNNSVMRVSGDAQVIIPFNIFGKDFKANGKTIEIDFATRNVLDFQKNIISCFANNIGIQITPQRSLFRSALSSVSGFYKDEERVRITYVITKALESHFIFTYLNGIMSGIVQYQVGNDPDSFSQLNPVGLTIKSENLNTIDIYNIRVYDTDLNTSQVVGNFIADMADIEDKLFYYHRNNILDDSGNMLYNYLINTELPYNLPVMILTGELPPAKGVKRPVDIEFIDPSNPAQNFIMIAEKNPEELGDFNANVQGTSSAVYPRKNYKFNFNKGATYQAGSPTKLNKGRYALLPGEIPNSKFTMKADFAESSGTHNTGIAMLAGQLYKDLNLQTPPQIFYNDPRIRTTVFGFPIAMFHRMEPQDTPVFIGRYNFNLDKDAEANYGLDDEDFPRCKMWEFTNNAPGLGLFQDNDFYSNIEWVDEATGVPMIGPRWKAYFEARFPEDSEEIDSFKDLFDWFMDCRTTIVPIEWNAPSASLSLAQDTSRAYLITDLGDVEAEHTMVFDTLTNAWIQGEAYSRMAEPVIYEGVTYLWDSEQYRVAKFKAEAHEHFNLDWLCFYYILTDILGMTDQRAKNMFMATWGPETGHGAADIWYPTLYDNDTALGIKNTGEIAFDYTLERDSIFNDQRAYNGHASELWIVVEKALASHLGQTYAALRQVFDYNRAFEFLNDNQSSKWSEVIYNEDHFYKYIDTLYGLANAQGSRADHRKWWLYNRFKYTDSRYGLGEFLTDDITMRINTPNAKRYILDVVDFDGDIDFAYRVVLGAAQFNIVEHSVVGNTTTMGVKLVAGTDVVPASGEISYTQDLEKTYAYTLVQTIQNDLVIQPSMDFSLSVLKPGYVRAEYSNLQVTHKKMSANVVTQIAGPSLSVNDFETSIYPASNLKTLSGLASKYIGFMKFEKATKLRELIVGSSEPGYLNLALGSSDAVQIGALTLLQKLDMQNCPNVRNALDLSGCAQLEEVYLTGTNIPSISFANGGRLKKLYLPALQRLVLINQTYVEELIMDKTKIQQIRIENTPVDGFQIVEDNINSEDPSIVYIRLIGVDIERPNNYILNELIKDDYRGIDHNGYQIDVPGTAIITGNYHAIAADIRKLDLIQAHFPELILTYDYAGVVFADPAVEAIVLANWDTNADGMMFESEVQAVSSIQTQFYMNTVVATFDELELFTGLEYIIGAFYGCTALTSIKIPPTTRGISTDNNNYSTGGSQSFARSSGITSIDLATTNLEFIGAYAFGSCSNLTGEIICPPTLLRIRIKAFDATKITRVVFNEGLLLVDGNAFASCTFLTEIVWASTINELGGGAFIGCTSLTGDIVLPSGITVLSGAAFRDCNNPQLGTLTLPANATTIQPGFATRSKFKGNLIIPNSVTGIGVDENSYYYNDRQDAFAENQFTSITIGTGCQFIGHHSFANITTLQTLILSQGLLRIRNRAFYNCTSLQSLSLPSTLQIIGYNAFENCTGITGDIVIPNSVTSMDIFAFKNLTNVGLGNLTIGTGLTVLSEGCFYNNRFKGTIVIPSNITEVGGIFNTTGTFGSSLSATGLQLNTGLVLIRPFAFYLFGDVSGCGPLVIPSSVTEIRNNAFEYSKFTGDLIIPESVSTIGVGVIRNMPFITSIDIRGNVTSLSDINYHPECLTIKIPASVTTLDSYCFQWCPKLTSLTVLATTPPTSPNNILYANNTANIYVPAESVDAYKAATGWIAYAARIFAIPE